jgi:glc operon protein GlcG
MSLAQAYPAVFAQIVEVAGTPIVAGRAARLLRREGVVVGAIAIAGGTLEQDDECADVGHDSLSVTA